MGEVWDGGVGWGLQGVWEEIWDAIELQRVLVQREAFWEARVTDGLEHMLSTREQLALPGVVERVVWVTGDSTMDRIGAVDWTERRGASQELGPAFDRLRLALKDSAGRGGRRQRRRLRRRPRRGDKR